MPQRQFPKPDEIFELMRFKKPEFDAKKRRLESALTIYDLRDIARRRTPRAAFDYADGAAEGELSLARAREAFEDIEFHPSILKDVSRVDTSTTIFGGPSALPFGIAPTGRETEVRSHDFHQIVDGRIVRTHHMEDWLSWFQQVGSWPSV